MDKEKETLFDETGEPIIEENTGEGAGEGTGTGTGGEDGNWEKRYKDLQSHSDQQLADKDKEIGKLNGLVSPFRRNIKETGDGDLIFDFSDTPEKKSKEEENIPEEPTADEFFDDNQAATKKQIAFNLYQERQEKKKEKSQEEQRIANENLKKARGENWEKAVKLWPVFKNKDSEEYREADKWLNAHPELYSNGECDYIAIERIALQKGIKAAVKEEAPAPKKKDTTYIISGDSGKGGGKKEVEKETETDEEYIARRKTESARTRGLIK